MRMSAIAAPLLFLATVMGAQGTTQRGNMSQIGGFEPGQNVLGAVVGVGNLGSAAAALGGRYEHAIKYLPDLSNGVLSVALDADWYSYSANFGGYNVNYRYVPIGATANYHFRLSDRQWDPFFGVGFGYSVVSASADGASASASSGMYVITRVGVRYFYRPNLALQADAGAGAAALSFGLVYRP